MTSARRVAVVGGGVIGLSAAVRLLEAGFPVSVLARDRTPRTTSDIAGAVFYPYLVEPKERVAAWGKASFARFARLARKERSGVVLSDMLEVRRLPSPDPWWAGMVEAFRRPDPATLPPGFRDGFLFRTPRADMPRYLRFLEGRVAALGGTIAVREVGDLREPRDQADIVVNCAGLGARELARDPTVFPIRGQMVRVRCPEADRCLLDEDVPGGLTYVVPRRDEVLLGGTAQPHRGDLEPDPGAERDILARCAALFPPLARAEVTGRVVGLRPGRPQVRLELERLEGGPAVIHDYGHGGAGVTLSWGCAEEVAALALAAAAPA